MAQRKFLITAGPSKSLLEHALFCNERDSERILKLPVTFKSGNEEWRLEVLGVLKLDGSGNYLRVFGYKGSLMPGQTVDYSSPMVITIDYYAIQHRGEMTVEI